MKTLATAFVVALSSTAGADTEATQPPRGDAPVAEVLFEFDSARIPAGTSDRLAPVVTWSKRNPEVKIVLDGHADRIGASDYNVGLSLRRADALRSQLVRLGVDEDNIILVGYGEDGLRRSERALNRRVTVWTTSNPLYAIVDQALVRATAVIWDEPVPEVAFEGPVPSDGG